LPYAPPRCILVGVDILTGVVERLVFQHPETHFTVARLRPDRPSGGPSAANLTTVVGALPGVRIGESLYLEGQWATHQSHGREFRILRFTPQLPESVEGIRRYLGSGLIKGIGPVVAARIVDQFGAETLAIIEQTPVRLLEVAGISRKRVEMITGAWAAQQEIKGLMLFLQAHQVPIGLAARIFRAYGNEALAVVRTDPFRMVKDVRGIGFRTADDLATRLGLPPESPARYAAALKHVLSQATGEGHVYLPEDRLLERGAALLRCPLPALRPALDRLLAGDEAIRDGDAIYLTPLFLAEHHTARRLALLRGPSPLLLAQPDAAAAWGDQPGGGGEGLSEAQRQAIAAALGEKLCILTGGPGVGKSTTVRGLVAALSGCGIRFCLAAPTGRAAKRLAEATGHPAQTLHRLLGYSPTEHRFATDEDHPLPYQFVVADEASMLDLLLFYALVKALRPGAHLLLVGDADQLPSVGPGNILRDLIASGAIPVLRLRELFRQAQRSRIVTAAHRINAGEMPDLRNDRDGDLFFIQEHDPSLAVATICALVAERIPARYGFDPRTDIQVISPMHKGALGVAALNQRLQARLNPSGPGRPELDSAGRTFRLGDRVMQTRNDYDRNVFNGDMGLVASVDPEDGTLQVCFDPSDPAATVAYNTAALEELTHAYAVSVHKAQGSEFPCVILAIAAEHQLMLQRPLLYTALTRARKLCIIVGSASAIGKAIATTSGASRYTDLARRLILASAPEPPPSLDR